jgi:uncharacterized membrane protein YhaH (DUF805 family)
MLNTALLLAQDDGNAAGGIGAMIGLVLYLAVIIVVIAGLWKTFEKAGKPGWASLIPIYNIIVMLEIAGKPLWWIILFFIPCVNFVAVILVFMAFAKAFGKSEVFGLGLAFLGFIFFPILGFGDAKYVGAPRS